MFPALLLHETGPPPPNHVKPFPIVVLRKVAVVSLTTNDAETQCVCNMIIVTYLFLLRHGEYTGAKSDSTPFRMCDISFSCGRSVFDHNSDERYLFAATMLMLLFTTQKNDVKGEVVGQGPSGDPLLCPRDSLSRRIIHLRKHNADKTRPIASFMTPKGSWEHVTPAMITKVLKGAVSISWENLDFLPETSRPGPYGWLEPWRSCVPVSTRTSSG